jgi:hypothetical protein
MDPETNQNCDKNHKFVQSEGEISVTAGLRVGNSRGNNGLNHGNGEKLQKHLSDRK